MAGPANLAEASPVKPKNPAPMIAADSQQNEVGSCQRCTLQAVSLTYQPLQP